MLENPLALSTIALRMLGCPKGYFKGKILSEYQLQNVAQEKSNSYSYRNL